MNERFFDFVAVSFTIVVFCGCSELVVQNPRPYNVVALYTVRHGCDDCQLVLEEYKGTSYSYQAYEENIKVPTFFSVVFHSKTTKSIFESHKFVTVPYLTCSEMKVKRDEGDFYKLEDIWRIKKDTTFETQQQLDFINKRFINDVPLK